MGPKNSVSSWVLSRRFQNGIEHHHRLLQFREHLEHNTRIINTVESGEILIESEVGQLIKPSCDPTGWPRTIYGVPRVTLGPKNMLRNEKVKISNLLCRSGHNPATCSEVTRIGIACVPVWIDADIFENSECSWHGLFVPVYGGFAKMCMDFELECCRAWKCDENVIFHIFMLLKPTC